MEEHDLYWMVEEIFYDQLGDELHENPMVMPMARYHMNKGIDDMFSDKYDLTEAMNTFKRFISRYEREIQELIDAVDEIYDEIYEEDRDRNEEEGMSEDDAAGAAKESAFNMVIESLSMWKSHETEELCEALKRENIQDCEDLDDLREMMEEFKDIDGFKDSFENYINEMPYLLIEYYIFKEK